MEYSEGGMNCDRKGLKEKIWKSWRWRWVGIGQEERK
jgi:hypothetical protein